jgi:hypothetical protein
MAGQRPQQVFSNQSAQYDNSTVAGTRRGDDALFSGSSRANMRSRFAHRSYNKDERRVKTPEFESDGAINERRDGTIAARKAKEEEARLKALYG